MDGARRIASALMGGILSPFSGHNPMVSLVPLSAMVGIGMLWVFRRTSDQKAIRKVKRELQAHLYEMRLFTDEPLLIWKAQWSLLKANGRYLGRMLVPVAVMTIPMVVIFTQLECFYGYAPLKPGQEAIVTVQMKNGASSPVPVLRAPEGIVIGSPAIRVEEQGQISWRIHALRPVTGELQFLFSGQTLDKSVKVGAGPQYVSERRVSSTLDLLWHPAESRLPAGPVDWIELRYPKATVHAVGLDLDWFIWMLILSLASGLIFKRQFRVSF
jgi:uncharacterized membrane protein (DUF106 family)